MTNRKSLDAQAKQVARSLRDGLLGGERLQLVKAPPGAGKTHLLLELLAAGFEKKMRLAVATFTNAQADDISRRLANDHPKVEVHRFISNGALEPDLGSRVRIIKSKDDLPRGPGVVVATTAKWAFTDTSPFDALLIDEAWQIGWADFQLLLGVASRFVLIGDPGQIPPVVSIPTERWETSPNPPHLALPDRILNDPNLGAAISELPGSRRLPHDAVELVNKFYDFTFGAFAEPNERYIRLKETKTKRPIDKALNLLAASSIVGVTMPTSDSGPPAEIDDEIAKIVSDLIARLLSREPMASHLAATRNKPLALEPSDIGIVSSHRVMNTQLHYRLPPRLQGKIRVETPERWQGLQCKLMIAIHPLSGVSTPSAFDLETGRLCVMASRHQSGLLILSRDHVPETLRTHIVTAEQPVGRRDVEGIGHHRNSEFWAGLEDANCIVAL